MSRRPLAGRNRVGFVTRDNLVKSLKANEGKAIVQTLAFMSYNPSIGRVLERDGVKKFQGLAERLARDLPKVDSRDAFDCLHDRYVQKLMNGLETARHKSLSYGQAQKAVNVFLKVYVDWAGLPNRAIRRRLLPWLHVPLDSIIMKGVGRSYPRWYAREIRPLARRSCRYLSLPMVDHELYHRWQRLFREKWPPKPLLFDVVWAMNR